MNETKNRIDTLNAIASASDDASFHIRNALIDLLDPANRSIDCNNPDCDTPHADRLRIAEIIRQLFDDEYARDALSTLALDYSLCPLHFIDYAICFDDDDDECAAIRHCFPSHDT